MSPIKAISRIIRKEQTPGRVYEVKRPLQIADGSPADRPEAQAPAGQGNGNCSRVTAEVRLVGIDSKLTALHTESNWRGAFEHTTPQAAIMAVLALLRRLTEQTEGSPESNQKVAAALDDLLAAFKDRKPRRERH